MQRFGHLIVICVLVGLGFESRALGDEPPSVNDTIAAIRATEAKARAVEVKGFKGQSFVRNEAGELVPTPKTIEGSVIRDGTLGGRYVLDRTETIPVGSADSARFASRASVESYDGKEGRIVRPPAKAANGRERKGQAEISATSPAGLATYASLCDGSAASPGYFRPFLEVEGSKSPLLGDALATMVEQGVALTVSHEKIGGTRAIKIADPFGNSYWFDPAKGFCLLQAISADPSVLPARPFRKLVVEQFAQLDEKSWYPIKGRWEDPASKTPGAADKVEFTIQSASLLKDLDFDYKAKIPPGYMVHDLVSDKVFTSTGDEAERKAPPD